MRWNTSKYTLPNKWKVCFRILQIFYCTSVALGREHLSICLQDWQFVYKTGRRPTTNILVYLCGVRARKSVNLFTRRAICLQDGEGSNDNNNNNDNLAFPRGGPERGNPAMTTKRLRQGVKETHQHKCLSLIHI